MTQFGKYFKRNRTITLNQRKAIHQILENGPTTVTAISEKVEFGKPVIVWNLLSMLRWGEVEVTGEEHHELVYGLKEV
jgi:hypothetical protein